MRQTENTFDPELYTYHLRNEDFDQFFGQNVFDPEFLVENEGLIYTHADRKIKSVAPSQSILADYLLGIEKGKPLNVSFDPNAFP